MTGTRSLQSVTSNDDSNPPFSRWEDSLRSERRWYMPGVVRGGAGTAPIMNIFFAANFSLRCNAPLRTLTSSPTLPTARNNGRDLAQECVRRAVLGMQYADDSCSVPRSSRGLELMMMIFVDVFGAFSLTVSEKKTYTMCVPAPHMPAVLMVSNTCEQQYRQTTLFVCLGGQRH